MSNSLGEWLPFNSRLWLHLAVVAVVAVSALLGSRFLQPPSPAAAQANPRSAPKIGPLSKVGYAAPAVSTPALAVAVAAPTAVLVRASQQETRESIAQALALPLDSQPELLAKAQDGVVAVRAVASSRGGARAVEPAPTPAPTPIPTTAPTPTPEPKKEPLKTQTYTVEAGDSLLRIAANFGITPETILWANDLGNGDLLQIGQELIIPPVSGVLHKVAQGETFNSIAESYTADPARIVEVNLIANADQLQEGQILIVPGGMRRTVSVSGLPSAPSQQEIAAALKYSVKPDDTLLSIADAFGVRASVIQVANNLMDPDKLQIGQELSISGARQAAAAPKPQAAAPKPQAAAPKPAAAPAPIAAAPVSGDTGDQIAAISQRYLGYRYVWGGTSPAGFDCSGFAWYVYKQAGVGIPRAPLEGQIGAGPRVSRDKLLPGDLVFFQNTYKAGLSHVGIYLGGGRWINAEDESVGVQTRSLSDPYWAARYVGASRPW